MYTNIRSLISKGDEPQSWVMDHQPVGVALTETQWKEEITDSEFVPEGYTASAVTNQIYLTHKSMRFQT